MENIADDHLIDDEGGPAGSLAQALIWKLGGETNWRCGAADNDETNPAHPTEQAACRLNERTISYQSVMIDVTASGEELIVTYWVDPSGLSGFEPLTNPRTGKPWVDVIRSANANRDMSLVVGIKQASSTACALWVDWAGAWMGRNRVKVN